MVATSGPEPQPAASAMMSTMDPAAYDELSLFQENASEFGLPWPGPPSVRREDVALTGGGTLSALVWGPDVGPPELVFLHGTAMNAHTWDTVALALDRPLVAFDLPGHGHSSWRDDSTYSPDNLAEAVAQGVERLAPAGRRRGRHVARGHDGDRAGGAAGPSWSAGWSSSTSPPG